MLDTTTGDLTAVIDTATLSIVDDAEMRMRQQFSDKHHLTDEQWTRVRQQLQAYDDAYYDRLSHAAHVFAFPPGMAKSVGLACWTSAHLDREDRRNGGVLILVDRKEECRAMARALSREGHFGRLYVFTSDPAVNKLGGWSCHSVEEYGYTLPTAPPTKDANGEDIIDLESFNKAQVIITTHERLRLQLAGRSSVPVDVFQYLGARRKVIAWDEALRLSRPIALDVTTLSELAGPLQALALETRDLQWLRASTALTAWATSSTEEAMSETFHHRLSTVPPLDIGEADDGALERAAGESKAELVRVLRFVNGGDVRVMKQGRALLVLHHFPEIDERLFPVIVTDASAAMSETYREMQKNGRVARIVTAPKTYDRLTIKTVQVEGASRDVFKTKPRLARALLDRAAAIIRAVPADEPILVVGYLGPFRVPGERGIDAEGKPISDRKGCSPGDMLRGRLSASDRKRFRYLHYGQHKATNDHVEVKHMILLGLDHPADSLSYARAAAAAGLDLTRAMPTPEQAQAQRDSYVMDSCYQAITRGHARRLPTGDERCGECHVTVFTAGRHGLDDSQWNEMFPGVDLQHVYRETSKADGPLARLLREVDRRLAEGDRELTNKSLYEAAKIDRKRYEDIIKKAGKAAMDKRRLAYCRLRGRTAGWRLAA